MTTASVLFDDSKFPAELKALRHWVCWKAVPKGERIEKIPVCAATGGATDVTDPHTWTDYSTALMSAHRWGLGIGFVFSKDAGIVGVDLDKCRDAQTGALEPWAEEIVASLDSYTEISPSSQGVHIFLKGPLPTGKRKKAHIEAYESGRFFTVTGNHLPGTLRTIEERTHELAIFHGRYLADPIPPARQPTHAAQSPPSLSDQDILAKCRTAGNATKFEALWRGDWRGYPSQSEADLALLGQLKFYTQEAGQLDELFRQSGLMRPKWDERRGEQTYGDRSIEQALKHVTETYSS